MKCSRQIFTLITLLVAILFGQASFANMGALIYDAKTNQVLGAGTNLPMAMQQDRLFYLTAYHVTKGVPDLAVASLMGGLKLYPYKAWPGLDLAIYQTRPTAAVLGTPALDLAYEISLPTIQNLEELKQQREVLITMEGFDSQQKHYVSNKLKTRMAIVDIGRKGHSKIPLIVIDTPSAAGFSGGVISGLVEDDVGTIANVELNSVREMMIAGYRPAAIALIVGRSKDGQRTYAIPATPLLAVTGQFGIRTGKDGSFEMITTPDDVKRLEVLDKHVQELFQAGDAEDILDSGTGRLVEGSK